MEQKGTSVFLGIDINDTYAMISYYKKNMAEPETISTIAGSQDFQIPTLLAKRKGIEQWYYGEDARQMALSSEVSCVDFLLRKAIANEIITIEEECYEAKELFALYLKKIMELPMKLGTVHAYDCLIITVEHLTKEHIELFWSIFPKLGLSPENCMIIDHKESFYYFTLNQKETLWIHDVYLFEYNGTELFYYGLKRNTRTIPQTISIRESKKTLLYGEKDTEFKSILQETFEHQIVTTVYLVGEGFEDGWMKDSLQFLCKNRRVFMGNNLYCKGACYAGMVRQYPENWKFIYMGENEMKFNLSLKIQDSGNMAFYTLVSAGKNWYETRGECEVILSGSPEIEFWKQLPNSREAVIETLELTDLPKRPERATRIRIMAVPESDELIEVTILDLGFGEIYPSSNKSWKYRMTM